jgi:hypothetical protein
VPTDAVTFAPMPPGDEVFVEALRRAVNVRHVIFLGDGFGSGSHRRWGCG